jgi:uronate dehydrogenase
MVVPVAPLLALLAASARRGSLWAFLSLTGCLAFTTYSYAIYALSVHFGPLFLVWVAALGSSMFALAGALGTADLPAIKQRYAGRAMPTLAFFLPALFASGVLLHRRHPLGYATAAGQLVWLALTCLPILVTPVVADARGHAAGRAVTLPIGGLLLAVLAVLGRMLRRPAPEGHGWCSSVHGMRVLVSGAAGTIGTVVCSGLVDRGHEVSGLDRVPEPEGFTGDWFTADCADPDAVEAVFVALSRSGGPDAVVHLAGLPTESSLPDQLESHVITTAALLDAMVAHGVARIVYASSNHAVGRTPRSELLDVDVRPRPDLFYGVAKVAAEALLSLYVDRHGIDAVAARIGSFLPQPESLRALSTWLSYDDAVRMFDASLTAPDPGFAVLYGVSDNTRGWWDLAPGRALGYRPEDDAERFAEQVLAAPADEERDAAEAAYVGGPCATDAYIRPALDASGSGA